MSGPEFDRHADTYDADLEQALAASGESKQYFACGRVNWLSARLQQLGIQPGTAIDYGCGIGDTCPILRSLLNVERVTGLDVSPRSLQLARERNPDASCQYSSFEDYRPVAEVDLVYCNGVFHHIAPAERPQAISFIRSSLRAGGLFAFWENNAWSPATRYVMARCSFDRDAVPISPSQSKVLLSSNGFEILCLDFLFFFPSWLRWLRVLEPHLTRIPLGAQYLVLCRKM
jgi:SAM-dependent methyltransferase